MNSLSLLNTAARASGMKDQDSFISRDDNGQDDAGQSNSFASMLNTQAPRQDSTAQAATTRRAQPRREDDSARRDDNVEQKDPAPRSDATQDKRASRADAGKKTQASHVDEGSQTDETASTEEGASDKAAASQDDAGAWPPPGLGGFGLMLLQPTAAAPTADAAPLLGNAGTGLLPGLPGADPAAAAATPAPATPGAIALPGQAAAQTATAVGSAGTDAAALASMAAAAVAAQAQSADAGGDDVAGPAIDTPAFVLPNLPHAATTGRTQDTGAVFSASPTPTPNLQGDDFDEAVGTRLTWLAEQKIGHAHIKITPNDLGPVEVHLQMDGDKVHASFTAAHADVRQALEQSLPRLRDMLGEHGFQLAHADVGAQQQGQRGDSGTTAAGSDLADAGIEETASVVVPASVLKARGLLDAYA